MATLSTLSFSGSAFENSNQSVLQLTNTVNSTGTINFNTSPDDSFSLNYTLAIDSNYGSHAIQWYDSNNSYQFLLGFQTSNTQFIQNGVTIYNVSNIGNLMPSPCNNLIGVAKGPNFISLKTNSTVLLSNVLLSNYVLEAGQIAFTGTSSIIGKNAYIDNFAYGGIKTFLDPVSFNHVVMFNSNAIIQSLSNDQLNWCSNNFSNVSVGVSLYTSNTSNYIFSNISYLLSNVGSNQGSGGSSISYSNLLIAQNYSSFSCSNLQVGFGMSNSGSATFLSNVTIANNLSVGCNAFFSSNVTISNNLSVNGSNSIFLSNVNILQNLYSSNQTSYSFSNFNSLSIGSNAFIGSNLVLTGVLINSGYSSFQTNFSNLSNNFVLFSNLSTSNINSLSNNFITFSNAEIIKGNYSSNTSYFASNAAYSASNALSQYSTSTSVVSFSNNVYSNLVSSNLTAVSNIKGTKYRFTNTNSYIQSILDISGALVDGIAIMNSASSNPSISILNNNGFVGIGTSNPQYMLDIAGINPSQRLIGSNNRLIFHGMSGAYSNGIDFITFSNQSPPAISINSIDNNFSADLQFMTKTIGATSNPQTEKMRLTNIGYFGIGTSNPQARVHAAGSEITQNGNNAAIIVNNTSSTSNNNWVLRGGAPGNNTPDNGFSIADGYGYRMIYTTTGFIGIGLNYFSPQYTLDVNGPIRSTSTIYANNIQGQNANQQTNDTLFFGNSSQTNFFLDRSSAGQFNVGYNTPKGGVQSSIFSIFNNSTDKLLMFSAQCAGSNSGSNTVNFNVPVGIGTTTPQYTLDVNGSARINNGNTTSGINMYILQSNLAIGNFNQLVLGQSVSTYNIGLLQFNYASNGSSSNSLSLSCFGGPVIYAGGTGIGIGTSTPQYTLDVNGSARVNGSLIVGTFSPTNLTVGSNLTVASRATFNGSVIINANAAVGGNLTVGAYPIFACTGNTAGPSYSFAGDLNTGIYLPSVGTIGVVCSNQNVAVFSTSNVGIGTTTPNLTLEINGKWGSTNNTNLGAPSFGLTGGIGDRVILWPGASNQYPYSFGMNGGQMWNNVPGTSQFVWYNGGSNVMSLNNNSLNLGGQLNVYASIPTIEMSGNGNGGQAVFNIGGGGSASGQAKCSIISQSTGAGYCLANLHVCVNPTYGSVNASVSDAKISIASGGNVGISKSNPGYTLDVNGTINTTGSVYLPSWTGTTAQGGLFWGVPSADPSSTNCQGYIAGRSSSIDIGSGSGKVNIYSQSGTVNTAFGQNNLICGHSNTSKTSGSSWLNPSDERIKQNIKDYTSGLEQLLKLRPVTYEWNGMLKDCPADSNTHIGFVAQEVNGVLKECINIKSETLGGSNVDDFMEVDVHPIPFVLINSVRQQNELIVNLRTDLEILRQEVRKLKDRVS